MYLYRAITNGRFPKEDPLFIEAKNVSHAESIIKTEYGEYCKITEIKELTHTNEILREEEL